MASNNIKDTLTKLSTLEKHQLIKELNGTLLNKENNEGTYKDLIETLKKSSISDVMNLVEDLSKEWNVTPGASLKAGASDDEEVVSAKEKDSFVVELKITDKPLDKLAFVKVLRSFRPSLSMPDCMNVYQKFSDDKIYNFSGESFDKDIAQQAKDLFSPLVNVELK